MLNVSQATCAAPVLSVFKVHVIASSKAQQPSPASSATAPTRHASVECGHWTQNLAISQQHCPLTQDNASSSGHQGPSAGAAYC